MLLIILLGLIAKLTSVSGDCVVGTQNVNFNWDNLTGDRLWYFRLHTSGGVYSNNSCVIVEYARPEGNISQITVWSYDISAEQHVNFFGYATNWNRTYWEEIYPQQQEVYVAYRKPFPDEETVNLVKKKLEENNIEYSQLADWPMTNCK